MGNWELGILEGFILRKVSLCCVVLFGFWEANWSVGCFLLHSPFCSLFPSIFSSVWEEKIVCTNFTTYMLPRTFLFLSFLTDPVLPSNQIQIVKMLCHGYVFSYAERFWCQKLLPLNSLSLSKLTPPTGLFQNTQSLQRVFVENYLEGEFSFKPIITYSLFYINIITLIKCDSLFYLYLLYFRQHSIIVTIATFNCSNLILLFHIAINLIQQQNKQVRELFNFQMKYYK